MYKHLIEVVPGEAELYCARFVKQNGGTIFTSDSDLLVHDIGTGSVSFFRDLSLVTTKGVTSVKCVQYQLDMIAKRLTLPETHGLRSLAFEISLDVHLSFPQLLQRASALESINLHKRLYEEFCSQYNSLPMVSALSSPTRQATGTKSLKTVLQHLDPRISEYVFQFPFLAKAVGQEHSDSPSSRSGVEVFMPFLLDCPTKTSAWEISTAVRQLAYGMLNLAVPSQENVDTITEQRRVTSSGSTGREWQLPTTLQMEEACEEMLRLIQTIRTQQPQLSPTSLWLAMSLYQDASWGIATEKTPLSKTLIERRDTPLRVHWNVVHFLAQVHGSYYSFRILRQMLDILISSNANMPDFVSALHRELQHLPPLSELQSLTVFSQWLVSEEATAMLKSVHEMLGLGVTSSQTPNRKSKQEVDKKEQKKRKRDNIVATATTSVPKRQSTNMYDLLEADW